MGTTVKTFGIIAGVLGLLAGILEITIGGAASGLGEDGGGTVVGLGIATFAIAVVGLTASVSAWRRGWLVLVLAGVLGFVTCGLFWILSGPLFLLAGLVAFGRRKRLGEQQPRRELSEIERIELEELRRLYGPTEAERQARTDNAQWLAGDR
ncbi:MAG: hypothetical protein R3C15_15600 [Thermoleophilia bacterium]